VYLSSLSILFIVGGFVGPVQGKGRHGEISGQNAVENETFFLILAIIWPTLPVNVPDCSFTAILDFVYLRFVHFALHCLIKMQPRRAIARTLATVVLTAMAFNVNLTEEERGQWVWRITIISLVLQACVLCNHNISS